MHILVHLPRPSVGHPVVYRGCSACRHGCSLNGIPGNHQCALGILQERQEGCDLPKALAFAFREIALELQSSGAATTRKPCPMQKSDIKKISEAATSGSTSVQYGRLIAFTKFLQGCRNPVFGEWRWDQLVFTPTLCTTGKHEEVGTGPLFVRRTIACGMY